MEVKVGIGGYFIQFMKFMKFQDELVLWNLFSSLQKPVA